jgi:hypothetical protein
MSSFIANGKQVKCFYLVLFFEPQISIWDDRKVFGTRIESMKNGILGDNPPILDNNGNSLNPSSNPTSNSKAARKDSGTIVKVSCLLSWVYLTSDILNWIWEHHLIVDFYCRNSLLVVCLKRSCLHTN